MMTGGRQKRIQINLFGGGEYMTQIMINLTEEILCPTLQSSAFAKARVEYFLGQGSVWKYPSIMVIVNGQSYSDSEPSARHEVQ